MIDGEYAPILDMSTFWDIQQGCQFNDSQSNNMAKFLSRIGGDSNVARKIQELQNHTHTKDAELDILRFGETTRTFLKSLVFVSYYISVWILIPLQV